MEDYFDLWERTTLTHIYYMAGLWCHRKGSDTSTSPPSYLLWLHATHQRFHRYIPPHDFLIRVNNGISDFLCISVDLTDTVLLSYMDRTYPQRLTWWLWTLTSALASTIASALYPTTSPRSSFLDKPLPLVGTGQSGPSSAGRWPSNPYLYHTGIRCLPSTHLSNSTGLGTPYQSNVK